ncbi:hypothetical protein OM999_02345 [Mycoplasmopsis cynos]|uniref:Uncharacterized protein n=1 Tax=Mycoplasmopsis cynos (strain C142) TaxID=1246955 RepID=L0RV68_MYCC1|nr:hypothetical protein OM999_02345 [Mycoplasmopsis cynos]CCP24504.1 Hypothetical protein MCYN_0772 [Mycoplasmopsis cynos C142]
MIQWVIIEPIDLEISFHFWVHEINAQYTKKVIVIKIIALKVHLSTFSELYLNDKIIITKPKNMFESVV